MASLGIGAAALEVVPGRPEVHFAAEVPDDLRAVASSTWDRFLQVLPARLGCMADVTLRGAWRFGTRGAYDPRRRLVTVRIPGTASNLRATMVHEFAHHLEFTCSAQRRLRPHFLAAQGFPLTTPWRGGHAWAQIPSEQFAEAMVQVVLGAQHGGPVVIGPEAVQVIRHWGRGD
jgi:hypothetical protein